MNEAYFNDARHPHLAKQGELFPLTLLESLRNLVDKADDVLKLNTTYYGEERSGVDGFVYVIELVVDHKNKQYTITKGRWHSVESDFETIEDELVMEIIRVLVDSFIFYEEEVENLLQENNRRVSFG